MNQKRLPSIPDYAKRAKKAILTRDKLVKTLGPRVREVIEEKQNRHGFRWAARTALTDLKITDPLARKSAIHLAEAVTNQEGLRQGIESNKPFLIKEKSINPVFENAYHEALFMLKETSRIQESSLVKLFGSVRNANTFLEKIYQHQKRLGTAWEKQEEFIKAEKRLKRP